MAVMLIGYARVSSADQRLDLQLDALKRAGCERLFTDQASGAGHERPGLTAAQSHLRRGDTLMVWKLDRLGRSVRQLVELVSALERDGIHFASITDRIDTATSAGRFFFHVMAALAEMERDLIRQDLGARMACPQRRERRTQVVHRPAETAQR